MGRALSARAHRREIFLEALRRGISAVQAAAHGGISWTTLYRWRRQDPAFRDAWDNAARASAELLADRHDDQMMRRATQPVAHPIVHRGEIVGVRQRYSDAALMFAVREMRLRRERRQQVAAQQAAEESGVRVIIAPVDEDE